MRADTYVKFTAESISVFTCDERTNFWSKNAV